MNLTPNQKRLYELLKERISPDIAQMYLDAVEELTKDPPSITVVHKVTHLLRDVESAVLAVVEILADSALEESQVKAIDPNAQLTGKPSYQRRLLNVLTGKDFTKLAKEVHGHKGTFADIAHRSGLGIRRLDAGTLARIEAWEKQLTQYLEESGKLFGVMFKYVDKLATYTPRALVSQLSKIPLNLPLWERLFKQINTIEVFEELEKQGLLASPPGYQTDSMVGIWLPMVMIETLLKMAQTFQPEVRDRLFDLALKIPFQTNERAAWKIVDIALLASPAKSAELAEYASALRSVLVISPFPADIGRWIAYLAENEQIETALKVFGILFDPTFFAIEDDFRFSNNSYQLQVDLDFCIPSLAKGAPRDTLTLLANQLDAAIRHVCRDKSEKWEESFTYVWKDGGSIGDTAVKSHGGVVELSINTFTRAFEAALAEGKITVEEVLVILEPYKQSKTFRRIMLFVASKAKAGEGSTSMVAEFIDELSKEEARHADTSTSWEVHHISPLSLDDMKAMDATELVAYISRCDLPQWVYEGPDKTGLLNNFEEIIRENPAFILDKWEAVWVATPETVYLVCRALADTKSPVELTKLLQLFDWLISSGFTKSEDNNVGHSLIRAVRAHVLTSNPTISISSPVWRFASRLALEEPLPDVLNLYEIDGVESVLNRSINTPHSMAAELLFDSLFRANTYRQDIISHSDYPEFKSAFEVLAKHTSPLNAFIVGRNLHLLLWLDAKWAMSSIVPDLLSDENPFKRDSAWFGFLISHRISDELLPYYRDAILRLDTSNPTEDISDWHPAKQMAGHIIFLYFERPISLDEDLLLKIYFQRSPYKARRKALSACKQFIKDSKALENLDKLKQLWDYRFKTVTDEHANGAPLSVLYELHALLGWMEFIFELDEAWFCEQTSHLIRLTQLQEGTGNNHHSSRLITLLSKKEIKNPLLAARLVLQWAEAGLFTWDKRQLQTLLRNLIATGDKECITISSQIASLMCIRGDIDAFLEFTTPHY